MSDTALRVEGLSKQYRIGGLQGRFKYKTIRDTLVEAAQAPFLRAARLLRGEAYGAAGLQETIWALKEVSFEVREGEAVGIIGRNGAGKTTLLKVLSRITEPTEGVVDLYGRVGSLLEVGTGFHPELTGRENIYLNGAILGMKRVEIDRKFDEIVDFAEIEKFIDTPVKHYSSGMYVRLAFSVAAHLEPEILLVDEVLAVGDVEFQRKCLGKMQAVATQGRTVLFISHNLEAVKRLCQRGILLQAGKVVYEGTADQTCQEYLGRLQTQGTVDIASTRNRQGDGRVRITKMEVIDESTRMPVCRLPAGQPFRIRMHYTAKEAVMSPRFGFALQSASGSRLFNTAPADHELHIAQVEGEGTVELQVRNLTLAMGTYTCNLAVADRMGRYCDYLRDLPCFDIELSDLLPKSRIYDQNSGLVYPDVAWTIQETDVPVSNELATGSRDRAHP